MNKIIYLVFIFLFKNIYMIDNGDPFDYISSDIVMIYDNEVLINKILQNDKIIVIFSYLNNYYGDSNNDFVNMALIYNDLKKQFSNNKHIDFYRAHMSRGISPMLLDYSSPSMQIYYNGIKIIALAGQQNKSVLLKAIVDSLRKNLKSLINENEFITNIGGDDGN